MRVAAHTEGEKRLRMDIDGIVFTFRFCGMGFFRLVRQFSSKTKIVCPTKSEPASKMHSAMLGFVSRLPLQISTNEMQIPPKESPANADGRVCQLPASPIDCSCS